MLKFYIHKINPGAFIKKIESDEYCVVRTFLEGLLLCYDYEIQLKDTIKNFRIEIHINHKNYSYFSPDDINILTELHLFLTNPLKYYNADTVSLLLVALGNSYTCKTIIYHCKGESKQTTNMSDSTKGYNKILYLAKTNLPHLDLEIDVPGSAQPLPNVETNLRK